MAQAYRQCVILAGGLGTRLGSLVQNVPKPMLPVAGRPFLEHLVRAIHRFGFDSFIFLAGYRGGKLADHFSEGGVLARELGAHFRTVIEAEPCGTGGALKLAASVLEEEFLVCNGDSLFDFNLLDLGARPFSSGALARLALRHVADVSRYGTVSMENECITEFHSRPTDLAKGLINAGVYWMKAPILNFIATKSSLEIDVFPQLAAEGRLLGVPYEGYFIDIGVPDEYRAAARSLQGVMQRPAVFFDRDGVLNEDEGYTHTATSFRWVPGAQAAIKACNDKNYLVFVVTNQSGVARGYYDEATVQRLHRWMQDELRQMGGHIDSFRYCPHHIEGTVPTYTRECNCRKPSPGMITDLLQCWPVIVERSVLIGDMPSDLAAGAAAGVRSYQFTGGDLHQFLNSIIA